MLNRQALLKTVSEPEERLLFAKVLDQADLSARKYEPVFTDFMDMAKSSKFLESVRRHYHLNCGAFGGYADCERRMLGFVPDYMEIAEAAFPIRILKITMNKKFGQKDLSHRDYLGSILGLGIDRGKVGDIILLEDETICYVQEDMADYICTNLESVSRTKVEVTLLESTELILPEKNIEYKNLTVSSLRLDAVVGAAFHLARGKAQDLIHGEKVNVNWTLVTSASSLVKEGDMISLRGEGRVKLTEVQGRTKKDRLSIVIGKYV